MSLYVPIVKKIVVSDNVLVERTLPADGVLNVKIGDIVEPFSKLGVSKTFYKLLDIGENFTLKKGKQINQFFYNSQVLGFVDGVQVKAPFNGYLVKDGEKFVFKEEDRDFWLLSGVWGSVVSVVEKRSILIKTQSMDVRLIYSSKGSAEGEFIVFPNPEDILEMQYLENFSKDATGKILYVGNYASIELLKRAKELGTRAILCGSTDYSSFDFAVKNGMFIGIFSGFGKIGTPLQVYDTLKNIPNRYVFIDGDKTVLRIPMEKNADELAKKPSKNTVFTLLKKSTEVQIFKKSYLGFTGKVDSIKGSSIFVRLDSLAEVVEVMIPDILALG